MTDTQLKAAEFSLYTEIVTDLKNLVGYAYVDDRQRQTLVEDLEVMRDCTEWSALRRRISNDLCRFDVKPDAKAGVEIGR